MQLYAHMYAQHTNTYSRHFKLIHMHTPSHLQKLLSVLDISRSPSELAIATLDIEGILIWQVRTWSVCLYVCLSVYLAHFRSSRSRR